jgi:hypothetical protein
MQRRNGIDPAAGQGAQRKQDYFTYSTGRLATLAAAAVSTTFLNIQADADFIVEKLTFAADTAGAALTFNTYPAPNVLVLLTSTGSGQNLMSAPVPLASMFGNAFLPFILPMPRVLPANSQLQITLTSVEAAVSWFLTLNFIGRKLYLIATGV